MSEPKGCRGKLVERGGRALIVVVVEVRGAQVQVKSSKGGPPDDARHELVVGDVLDLGSDDAPRLLEHTVRAPVRVDTSQLLSDRIVLAHHDGVHGGQARVLVNAGVAGQEAFARRREAFMIIPGAGRQVLVLAGLGNGVVRMGEDLEEEGVGLANLRHHALVRPIDHARVDVARQLIQLLTGTCRKIELNNLGLNCSSKGYIRLIRKKYRGFYTDKCNLFMIRLGSNPWYLVIDKKPIFIDAVLRIVYKLPQ